MFSVAEAMVREGRLVDAEALLLALTQDASLQYRSEARFRLGRLREAQGNREGALRWYQTLLAEDPGAAAVRVEVARLHAELGDRRAAARELRQTRTSELPDEVARFIDRFALALRSHRRAGGSVEIAVAPDSNINRAAGGGEIETVLGPLVPDADARATSGVGLSVAAHAFWRGGGEVPLLARMSARGDFYRRSAFNDLSLSAAVGPELTGGRSRWRPALLYVHRWFGGDTHSEHLGGSLNWMHALDAASSLEAEATVATARYPRLPLQNGMLYDFTLGYDRALGPMLSFRGFARASRNAARDPGYSTTGAAFGAAIARRIGGQTVIGEVSAAGLVADDRLALFPKRRRDTRIDLSAGVLLNRWRIGEVSPLIRLRRTWNRSSVDLYDFDQTRLEFGFAREF